MAELYRLFTSDPEASFKRMVEIAAQKGINLTVDEVKSFMKQMDEDDEFDDFGFRHRRSRRDCWW